MAIRSFLKIRATLPGQIVLQKRSLRVDVIAKKDSTCEHRLSCSL